MIFFLIFIYLFFCFWLCCAFAAAWAFSSCGEQGLLVPMHLLLIVVAFPVAECRFQGLQASGVMAHGLNSRGSWALEHRLGSRGAWACSVAGEIFLDQGLNPCLLHWREDSLPLSHRGNPRMIFES